MRSVAKNGGPAHCVLAAALVLLLSAAPAPGAPAAGQVPLSVVFSADLEPYREAWKGFRDHVQQRGTALQVSEFTLGKEPTAAIREGLLQKNPALVVALGPEAAKFAKEHGRNTPVVYCMVLRTAGLDEGNMTGVSMEISSRAKLDALRKVLPRAKRIGLIYSSRSVQAHREMTEACREHGCQVVGKEIEDAAEFPGALRDLLERIDAFFMVPDTKIYFPNSIEHLLFEGLRSKVPVIGLSAPYTRAGALLSVDAAYGDIGRQAGDMALRILGGEAPGRIAPQRPKAVRFTINAATAGRMGIDPPKAALQEAEEVFGR